MLELLEKLALLEPKLCQSRGNGEFCLASNKIDCGYMVVPDAATFQACGNVLQVMLEAISSHKLPVSLDYYPDENLWNCILFQSEDSVSDLDLDWDYEDKEATIAVLAAYVQFLEWRNRQAERIAVQERLESLL